MPQERMTTAEYRQMVASHPKRRTRHKTMPRMNPLSSANEKRKEDGNSIDCTGCYFEIPGTLPGLNEVISEAKSSPLKYARLKKRMNRLVAACAIQARVRSFSRPVFVSVTWYAPDRKRDKDNIAAGKKFILDGLQDAGVLANDGWNQIAGFRDSFEIDKANPRIKIELTEEPDEQEK